MTTVTVFPHRPMGKMKPMHAVNNGPLHSAPSQTRSNLEAYKAARIPYARNHDASEWIDYGGEFVVDIYSLFPNFDADPENPANYEFAVTDAYTALIQSSGTETFYRLGSRIEHQVKKYRTVMPKDFKKWAVICEHVIRHYTEGWAEGFYYDINYWEIWNEPDLSANPDEPKKTWSGTPEEFYEFYAVVATHLKEKFPHLKIGGPAVARYDEAWLNGFFTRLTRDETPVPLDFFSWHCYGYRPQKMIDKCAAIRAKIDEYGYTDAESILNEWNYVKDWREGWVDTVRTIISLKGAAYAAACMCLGQNRKDVDMLMYYDAAPCSMNGLFDFYSWEPLKGYWALYAFADLYDLGTCIETRYEEEDLYVTAAKDNDGKTAVLLCYYTDEESMPEKTVTVRFPTAANTTVYTVDQTHDYEKTGSTQGEEITLTLQPNTFAVLKR